MDKKYVNLLILFVEFILITTSVTLLVYMNRLNNVLNVQSEQRLSMLKLAEELHQSSDDLTHFARSYVVTQDRQFKEKYFATLDIRNGKKPRPLDYETVYWDLPSDVQAHKHPLQESISLKELMAQLPYDQFEWSKLRESEDNSNQLVNLEIQAFNAVEGKFQDQHKQYTIEKEKDPELAIRLLYSPEYYRAKEQIMTPIDDFVVHLNQRMEDSVHEIESKISRNYTIFLISALIFILFNVFALSYIYKRNKSEQEEKNMLLEETSMLAKKLRQANENLERKIKERTHKLEVAKIKAEESTKTKSEFLANMSHEIRTPMNAIIGMAQLALEEALEEKPRNYVNNVEIAAKRLLGIINDILDFSAIEAGKLQISPVHFYLKDAISSSLELIRQSASAKNVNIHVKIAQNVPKIYYADTLRLEQVLINLLNNAVKFSYQDGTVTLRLVLLEEGEEDAVVKFSVEDEGIGISSENQKKLFQSFSQADASTSRKFGGTGLGLVISQKIVELLGGHIWVESEEHKGSIFSFTVSMRKSDEDTVVKSVQGAEESMQRVIERLYGVHVLVVEDNEMNQELVVDLLERKGLYVKIANNGVEALEIIQTEPFDMVLMDIQMPIMDGYEATKRLRMKEEYKGLPILAMSANMMQGDIQKSLEAGMNAHIAKPIIPADMFRTMAKWIDNKK